MFEFEAQEEIEENQKMNRQLFSGCRSMDLSAIEIGRPVRS
jgi:hypothetical protein